MHELVILTAKYAIAIPVLAYVALAFLRRHNLKELLVFTAISALLTLILVKLATTLHSDPRPFIRDGVKPYFSSSTDNGFPSDHTVLSAAVACIVLRYNKFYGAALLVVAAVIGAARVKSGVHHGQDVVAALLIAGVSVYLGHLLSKVVMRKLAPKDARP